jgi:cytochrome c oxidase cbb3-type subunit 1
MVRLLGGLVFFSGMLIMAYNVWKTIAGQRAVDDAKIPAAALAHA